MSIAKFLRVTFFTEYLRWLLLNVLLSPKKLANCNLVLYGKAFLNVSGVTPIWSYSGPYFLAFGLNMERYRVSLRIQSECGKMPTRITPNTENFFTVTVRLESNASLSK